MPKVFGVPGTDPTLPDVTLIIGGVERHLVYDINAIVLAEKATGINLFQASVTNPSAETLRGLLWASLLKESPDMTLDEAGSLITMHNAVIVFAAIREAWFGSVQGDEVASEDETPGEAPAQTPAV